MRLRFVIPLVAALVAAACGGTQTAEPVLPAAAMIPLAPIVTTPATTGQVPPFTTVAPPPSTTTTTLVPTTDLTLEKVTTITGDIAPKSVVAAGNGLFFAQNMMYRHTITVYDDTYELVETIPDTVNLGDYGYDEYAGEYRGAPVEAVATSDGEYVYVSNYQTYGEGYSQPGNDTCDLADWDDSWIYRVSARTLMVDQVIPAGAVPKFLAITPDDRLVLVSNWCSFDLSVIDTATGQEVSRIPIGRHPRGIAITGDGALAYVAVMGSANVAVVDLRSLTVDWLRNIGANPRHVVLDPAGRHLYVSLNGEGTVAAVDLETGQVTARVASGAAPRSMAISDDGRSLYVTNYDSDTVSKIDTASFTVAQTVDVPDRPIGITFDATNREVWVASYSGAITVLREVAMP